MLAEQDIMLIMTFCVTNYADSRFALISYITHGYNIGVAHSTIGANNKTMQTWRNAMG
jgi:hypothetical protein